LVKTEHRIIYKIHSRRNDVLVSGGWGGMVASLAGRVSRPRGWYAGVASAVFVHPRVLWGVRERRMPVGWSASVQ